jgi:3-dehydroquinate synthase
MPRVVVPLAGRPYDVRIAPGLLANAGRLIARATRARHLLIVSDRRVDSLHGAALRRALGREFRIDRAVVPAGEASKSLAVAERLYGAARDANLGRDGAVLAFGGGVVGDLAGFVAATWQRGVDFLLVPTTLLSQVDSAVGGKVAVNVGGIKNSVGAFHQPRLVLADTDLLATLPRRELASGLAEVVKYGMIADAALFTRLEREAGELSAGHPGRLSRVVADCCRIKARIVGEDERESGVRTLLNYGHTIGHAFEAVAGGRLRHGEAVALGMRGAARLAVGVGWLSEGDRERQDTLLDRFRLPARFPGPRVVELLAKIKQDKKVRDRRLRFVLTRGIGSASVAPPIEDAEVRRVLAALLHS